MILGHIWGLKTLYTWPPVALTGGRWGPPLGPRFGVAKPKKQVKNHVFGSNVGSRDPIHMAPGSPHWGLLGASGGHPQDPVLGLLNPNTGKKAN